MEGVLGDKVVKEMNGMLTLIKVLVALTAIFFPFHKLAVLKTKTMRTVAMAPRYANPG